MRLFSSRPTLLAIAAALALSEATYAQYVTNSSSAQSYQRRLEADGIKVRDSLRTQRNTPSPRSNSESTSACLDRMQAANEAAKQSGSPAAYDLRAAERYADSKAGQEAAVYARYQNALRLIAEEKAAEAAKIRAVRASDQGLAARRAKANWEKYRAENHNFTPRTWAPNFSTPSVALEWYLTHDREAPNPSPRATSAPTSSN